ncbi:MAG: DUF1425 domain-containing protein, partial [Phycisphaerales bacterium]
MTTLSRLAVLAAACSLAGCGTVNTTSTRTEPAKTAVPAQTRVNDLLTEIFLSCKEVRMQPTKGGPLEVQVDVENNGFSYRTFAYRFDWVDANGSVIPSMTSQWKSVAVSLGATERMTVDPPDGTLVDFHWLVIDGMTEPLA